MISLVFFINSALSLPCTILHVESSLIANGITNREWAVRPPGSNMDAMPLDATTNTISPCDHRVDVKLLQR